MDDISAQIIVGFDPAPLKVMSHAAARKHVTAILDNLRHRKAEIVKLHVTRPQSGIEVSALAVIRLKDPRFTFEQLQAALSAKAADLTGIAYVERNASIRLAAFTDPRVGEQWALDKIGVTGAWNVSPSGTKIRVAIIDSGLRRPGGFLHADFGSNVEAASVCQPAGFFDDNVDEEGHGTFLAGTIAAAPDNAVGIASPIPTSWNIWLLPVKFFGANEAPNLANAVIAINHAVAQGAKVINASWHTNRTTGDRQALHDALRAAKLAGCVIVAAAGNDGTDNDVYPTFPANLKRQFVITVAATDQDDHKTDFSNYGAASVDIAAPGLRVLTTGTYRTGSPRYQMYSGTSVSAAMVSSGAALIFALNPGWSGDEVIDHLLVSADSVRDLERVCIGGKRLNLRRAVHGPLDVLSPGQDDVLTSGRQTTISWRRSYDNRKLNNVKIEFSKDNGATYPVVVAASVPIGRGTATWSPATTDATSQGRIRITPLEGNFPTRSARFRVV